MRLLNYNDCIGLNKPDRFYHYTQPDYAPNTKDQTVDYGGAVWRGQPGGGWTLDHPSSGGAAPVSGGNNQDPVALAQNLIKVQQQANAPAVQTLQGQIDPLNQRYKDLIDSIKGNQQVATNAATLTASNELGARGILPNSTYGQQQINAANLPVGAQYGQLLANTNLSQGQDVNTINNAIAQLQAGNPASSVQSATNYASAAQQAQATIAAAQAQAQAGIQEANIKNMYHAIAAGGGIYNAATGNITGQPTSPLSVGGNTYNTSTTNGPKPSLASIFGNTSNLGGFTYSSPAGPGY